MKSVLFSIKPKYCEMIVSGKKTIEVRKTRPKMIDVPFKGYIYCTKAREFFSYGGGLLGASDQLYRLPTGEIKFGDSIELMCCNDEYSADNFLNGKVIGEFVCDEISVHSWLSYRGDYGVDKDFLSKTCISYADLYDYGKGKNIYAFHISDLVIYNKPKKLSEFEKACNHDCAFCKFYYGGGMYEPPTCEWEDFELTRPPQSWCYVEEVIE